MMPVMFQSIAVLTVRLFVYGLMKTNAYSLAADLI